ncbi:MAG: hypothetical protein OHK0013_41260 [Sandaracinaceae bacterium]
MAAMGVGLVAAIFVQSTGCNYSYRFDPVHARALQTGGEATRVVVSEAVDARALGSPLGEDDEIAHVRIGVRDHLVRTGLVSPSAPGFSAPRTEAELSDVLARAASMDADTMLFVRIHRAVPREACVAIGPPLYLFGILPGLILDSLPLNVHTGLAVFEVVAVDPRTGELLGSSIREASFGEHVSHWGCGAFGVMHDMMGRSLQAALEDVWAQRESGWPLRGGSAAERILRAGPTRLSEGRFEGPGWSFDAGGLAWSPAARPPTIPIWMLDGVFRTEDGAQITFTSLSTWEAPDRLPRQMAESMPSFGSGPTETRRSADGRVVAWRESTEGPEILAAVATQGLVVTIRLTASAERMPEWRERLWSIVSSVRFDRLLPHSRSLAPREPSR